jgi:zinc transporter ZupT
MIYLLLIGSVLLGYAIALIINRRSAIPVTLLLAFSGAYLLGVSLFELLPEVYNSLERSSGLYIVLGLLLQIVLDFLSRGAEHGHLHAPADTGRFPILLFIGLSLHAVVEGIPAANNEDVLVGVMVHKVPIAIILGLYFIRSEYSRRTASIFLLLFALMTPLGSWISLKTDFLLRFGSYAEGIALGLFLHVATTILFESSRDHKFNLVKLASIIGGFVIAYLV